ncbi:nucleolar MIF4G domain-containing protein 1 [Coffea eugenioides]|uniref:nucleolar MIF4G domain-containing protein 1 n=1 Tax=Coffea eugenioides TaxID=49369 RepID=UPI000F60D122|nr:nucleolar MIF4G domain-containing protein 1 [Coffea eugenioides]
MEKTSGEKPRRERRKEARLAKNKRKFDSWVQHKQSSKSRKASLDLKPTFGRKLENDNEHSQNKDNILMVSDAGMDGDFEAPSVARKKIGKSRNSKTKFSEYLQMETGSSGMSAEKDLILERKLAKKLKVKNGKLGGLDDEINLLLDGIPSIFDSIKGGDREIKSLENGGASFKPDKWNMSAEVVESEIEYGSEEIENETESVSEEISQSNSEEEDNALELIPSKDSRKEKKRTRKTKFEEYLDMEEKQKGVLSANEDVELERKLSKKLKVKDGKLRGDDDDLNNLFEGISSALDYSADVVSQGNRAKVLDNSSLSNRSGMMKSAKQEQAKSMIGMSLEASERVKNDGLDVVAERVPTASHALGLNTKYVAPHLRSRARDESEEYAQIRRRVRGLLNRLSESNVESITGEVSTIVQSVGRSVGSQIIIEEVLESCSGGPRGNEQYAATFAAFSAGMACLVGIDFGAKLLASLAKCFEMEYLEEDNLSLRNLTLLLSYLYIFGVCTSDLVYDFMIMLSKRLTEVDVSTILTILQSCGMKLRADDPVGMKTFIQSVQQRANELKASSGNGQSNMSGKRMEFMLETLCDIKNNKKRPKEETVQHTRVKKWLQKVRVGDILIGGLKWSKLLDPEKKGQWWLSGDIGSTSDKIEEVASKIDREAPEAQRMLQLAAAQRMNTDARRAIFCVIMSGEDFRDAFAKLLSLDLHGKQDREIIRVLLECCLQEKVFNKYYTVLAHKLCKRDKNHKFTLQYCLWDHFKELETMPLIRSMHLAKFTAELVASYSLSLAVLKAVDLSDAVQLTPKRIMHFRMLFEAIFEFSDALVWNAFSRIAGTSEYESLRTGIKFFISKYVISSRKPLEQKFKIAKKALKNVKGLLL